MYNISTLVKFYKMSNNKSAMERGKVEIFGDRLRRLREEAGLSQRQLAKISGIAREYICQIEAGRVKNPTVRIAMALARGIKKPLAALIGEYEETFVNEHEEIFEKLLDRLKDVTPYSIPVYLDFPYHAGTDTRPKDYIYRHPKYANGNIEAYFVYGKCLEPIVSNGDIILVDRRNIPIVGDLVACLVDNKLLVARLGKIDNELWLETNEAKFKFADCQEAVLVIEVRKRLKVKSE